MTDLLLKAFVVAGASYTWCRVLCAPGMICAWVPRLVGKIRDSRIKNFVAKPVYACPVCNTFWLAIPYFLFDCNIEGRAGFLYFFPAALFFQVLILRTEQ